MLTRRIALTGLATATASLAMPAIRGASAAPEGMRVKNFEHLGHSNQGDHPDGVQVMINRKTAYIGGMFNDGISVVDATDPRQPRFVEFVAQPKNTRSHHLQVHDDLLFAVNGADPWAMQQVSQVADYYSAILADNMRSRVDFTSGLRIYDISNPAKMREASFFQMPGFGLHRMWYVGGQYLYASAHLPGYRDHILAVIDVSDIAKPRIAATWALPGMRADEDAPAWFKGHRVALHHMIVKEGMGYAAWRDGGYSIHDMHDPTSPKFLSHVNYAEMIGPDGKPLSPGASHTPMPLPGRKLMLGVEEATSANCAWGMSPIHVVDVSNPLAPNRIGTLPLPSEEDFCHKGASFGPHNVHENRPGTFQSETIIFATMHNAGLRVYDLTDAANAHEIAAFVPPPPDRVVDPRPGLDVKVCQSCDVFVEADGTTYVTDTNGGINILAYKGPSA